MSQWLLLSMPMPREVCVGCGGRNHHGGGGGGYATSTPAAVGGLQQTSNSYSNAPWTMATSLWHFHRTYGMLTIVMCGHSCQQQ
jgi:hypothetical protein